MKVPFNPNDEEYANKPAFVAEMQQFLNLCEDRYGATRFGQVCTIRYGVSVEYQMMVNFDSDAGIGSPFRAEGSQRSRAINFHLMVNYKERTDGVSAAGLQYDRKKFPELKPLDDNIESLLNEIKGGSQRTDASTNASQAPEELSPSPPPLRVSPTNENSSLATSVTPPVYDHVLVHRLRFACELSGATLTDAPETNGAGSSIEERESISGSYAGTQFRVSIHGISNGLLNLEEFFSVWEEPQNARQMSLPGIKFLVDALDTIIASNKYIQILHQVRVPQS